MSEVIEINFGKEDRQHVRRFARLMGIVEEHEADIVREPVKHLKRASEEIALLRRQLFDARDAYRAAMAPKVWDSEAIPLCQTVDVMSVQRTEWEALQKMREIVCANDYQ